MTSNTDIFTRRYTHTPKNTAGIILMKISVKNETSRSNVNVDNCLIFWSIVRRNKFLSAQWKKYRIESNLFLIALCYNRPYLFRSILSVQGKNDFCHILK